MYKIFLILFRDVKKIEECVFIFKSIIIKRNITQNKIIKLLLIISIPQRQFFNYYFLMNKSCDYYHIFWKSE